MNGIKQRISDWQPRKLLCFSAAFSIMAALCTLCVSYDLNNWIMKLGVPAMLVGLILLLVFNEKLISFTLGIVLGFVWCVGFVFFSFDTSCELAGYRGDLELRVLEYYAAGTAASVDVTVLKGPEINKEVKAKFYLDEQNFSLRPGDRLILSGTLKKGDLNLARNRLQKGIYLTVNQAKNTDIKVETDGALNLTCKAARFSRAIQKRIQDLIPGDPGNLLAAMISGDSSICGKNLQKALANTGLAHIAAISGLHISILTGFFVAILGKRKGFLIALPLIIVYAVITGASPSAMRAVVMQAILMLSVFFYREYDAMTALFTALFLLLLQNPFAVLSASLLLSFSATFGILLLNGTFLHLFYRCRPKHILIAKVYGWLAGTIATSVSAMIFTMPITLLIFGRASMLSIISNLLTIWAVPIVMIGGIVILAFSVISIPIAAFLAKILRLPLMYLVWIIGKLGNFTDFIGQSGSLIMEAGAVFALICVILLRISRKEQTLGLVTTVLILLMSFAISSLEPILYNEVQIHGNYGAPIVLIRDGYRTISIGTGESSSHSLYQIEETLSGWNQSNLSAVICLSDKIKSVGGLHEVRAQFSPEHIFLPAGGYIEEMNTEQFWCFSGVGTLAIPDTTGKIELIPLVKEIWALRWVGESVSFAMLFDGHPMELAVGMEDYQDDISADILITDAKLLSSAHAAAYICGRVSPQIILAADSAFDTLPTQILGVPVASLYEQGTITLVTKR